MTSGNGKGRMSGAPLELDEIVTIETNDGLRLTFEVVGILEDAEAGTSYAVLVNENDDDASDGTFIVTDLQGNLLEDVSLAQEIIDEFLGHAEDAE